MDPGPMLTWPRSGRDIACPTRASTSFLRPYRLTAGARAGNLPVRLQQRVEAISAAQSPTARKHGSPHRLGGGDTQILANTRKSTIDGCRANTVEALGQQSRVGPRRSRAAHMAISGDQNVSALACFTCGNVCTFASTSAG